MNSKLDFLRSRLETTSISRSLSLSVNDQCPFWHIFFEIEMSLRNVVLYSDGKKRDFHGGHHHKSFSIVTPTHIRVAAL